VRAGLAAALATLALAVAGCGGDDSDGGEAARGTEIDGDGYAYSLPRGWTDRSDDEDVEGFEVGGFGPDTLVSDRPRDGFATNVNVVLEGDLPDDASGEDYAEQARAALQDPEDLPPDARAAVERLEPRGFSPLEELELDGEPAYATDYTGTQDGRVLRFRNIVTLRDGVGYGITLTALRDRFDEGLDGLDEVVESWRWG
jgi:hypothetical protein